ncbi:3809_t:CDS:1, partial [Cetraspora pellucida]
TKPKVESLTETFIEIPTKSTESLLKVLLKVPKVLPKVENPTETF